MEENKCPQCGAALDPNATECPYCGEKIVRAAQNTSQPVNNAAAAATAKDRLTAGLLAIFLGSLGIHKFYLGYKKEAVVMLVVCLAGSLFIGLGAMVMGVIGLIEGIMYLTKSDEEFQNIYVKAHKGWF